MFVVGRHAKKTWVVPVCGLLALVVAATVALVLRADQHPARRSSVQAISAHVDGASGNASTQPGAAQTTPGQSVLPPDQNLPGVGEQGHQLGQAPPAGDPNAGSPNATLSSPSQSQSPGTSSGTGPTSGNAPTTPPVAPAQADKTQPEPVPTSSTLTLEPPSRPQPTLEVPTGYQGTRVFPGVDCPGPGLGYGRIVQRGGALATCTQDGYNFVIPALDPPGQENRRSEVFWGTKTEQRYREGETMIFDGQFVAQLGPAARNAANFHFIWQAHGPRTDGSAFSRPLVHLNASMGRLVLGGGGGHPNVADAARWYKDVGELANETPTQVRIEMKLSTQATQGWVSVWVNGAQVLNRFHPPHGTFYPGGAWIQSRGGLYRGSPGGAQPRYQQSITWKISQIS